MRPGRLILVTGTHTEVGKTWWTAAVATELRRSGSRVAARKPVQSFAVDDAGPTDAAVLAAATGEPLDDVCPPDRSYPLALAPPMAAEILGVACPSIAEIVGETAWPSGTAVGFVEGVGGPRSPLASDGDTVDLAAALRPDAVVVVADATLGAINAVLLALAPFAPMPVVVALNRFDPADDLHRRNRAWLSDRCGLQVVTAPSELASVVNGPRVPRPRRGVASAAPPVTTTRGATGQTVPMVVTLDELRRRRHEIVDLARRHGAHDVRVFGSVARGEAAVGSDVDLLVEFEPGRSLLDQVHLIDDLRAALGVSVDVVARGGLLARDQDIVNEAVAL